MLRTGLDRTRYLLVKEAKIIAMTCTHAALKRKELVEGLRNFDALGLRRSGSFRPFRQIERPQEEEEIASFRNLWLRKRATEENVQVAWSADAVVKRG